METNPQIQEALKTLENVMVRQFRLLQELLDLSREEREALTHSDAEMLMPTVERKEALLDQIVLLEDQRRMQVEVLSHYLNVSEAQTSILSLLPHIPSPRSERIQRLSEGILSLATQIRDINSHNTLLINNALEWVASAQEFILSLYTQPTGHYGPMGYPPAHPTVSGEINQII